MNNIKYKIVLMAAMAIATSANALELSGGVSVDTKQSDYLNTAYLQINHNVVGLDFEGAIISSSDGNSANRMPKLYRLNVGSADGSFKFGRQAPKFGIRKTSFIKKSDVYNLTDIVEDGLSHSGKVDNFNYSLFYSKNLFSIDVNRDFTLGDFDFNLGGSIIDEGKEALYFTAKYDKFYLLVQGIRAKGFASKPVKVTTETTESTNLLTKNKQAPVISLSTDTKRTVHYEQDFRSHHNNYYVIELSYAITKRLWASYNNENTISVGFALNRGIELNIERNSGGYDAKIKYSF